MFRRTRRRSDKPNKGAGSKPLSFNSIERRKRPTSGSGNVKLTPTPQHLFDAIEQRAEHVRDPIAFDDLELVCAVLEEAQVCGRGASSAVAKVRGLQRSVVSNKLQRIEDRFDCILIAGGRARNGGLTEHGSLLLERGRQLLQIYERLLRELGKPQEAERS